MADYEVVTEEDVIEVNDEGVTIIDATAEEIVVEVLQSFDLVEVVTEETVVEVLEGGAAPPGPQGPPGPPGGSTITKLADGAVGAYRIVRATDATHVAYADAATLAHIDDVLGLSINAAADEDDVSVVVEADVTFNGWNWTPLETVYLGSNGQPTQIVPDAPAVFSLPVGYATSATSMRVRIGTPIEL